MTYMMSIRHMGMLTPAIWDTAGSVTVREETNHANFPSCVAAAKEEVCNKNRVREQHGESSSETPRGDQDDAESLHVLAVSFKQSGSSVVWSVM